MKWFYFILIFALVSCQGISVKDSAPETIKMNHQRVETEICGSHKVGINGCFFADGKIDQDLKVFNVSKGSLRVVGCGIDKSYRYDMADGEWFNVELKGMELVNDCALSLYQDPEFPGQDKLEFPIKGLIGSVFLGRCLAKQTCEFYSAQGREQFKFPVKKEIDEASFFMLSGCGKEKIPATPIDSALELDLGLYNEGDGCVFYLLLKNSKMLLKSVYWLNSYRGQTQLMEEPATVKNAFSADKSTMAYIQDGKIFYKSTGKIKDGFTRFYTSSGRSLVVEFKGGVIVWMQ